MNYDKKSTKSRIQPDLKSQYTINKAQVIVEETDSFHTDRSGSDGNKSFNRQTSFKSDESLTSNSPLRQIQSPELLQ